VTLLTFNNKYVITSQTAVTTTSNTLVDDTQASQTFTLSASQVVLVIYQANNVYGAAMPNYGMQNAISVDSVDKANSWDSPYSSTNATRNCVFWVGTLASGSHTIKGRFASNTSGSTATISNRVLVIIILDGDEFQYVDDATTATAPNSTFIDDPNAQVTFTPSGICKALLLYNAANSGATESAYGKKVAINVGGTDYGQAEKTGYGVNRADSVFTVHVLSLSVVSTTVKGRFANAGTAATVTINRRQLAVLLLADSTLMDVITSTTQVSTGSTSLVDDTQATISRTTTDTRELLAVAMGTKRYGVASNNYGECYGIKINVNDRANSRGSGGATKAESAGTAYAEQLAAGSQTVQGRFAVNLIDYTATISARQVVVLWFNVAAGGVTYPVSVSEPSISISDSPAYNVRRAVAVSESLGSPSDALTRVLWGYRTVSEPSISVGDAIMAGLFKSVSISESLGAPSDSIIYNVRRVVSISEPSITVSDGITKILWAYRTISEPSLSASDAVSAEKYVPYTERTVGEPSISVSDAISYMFQRSRVISESSISVSDSLTRLLWAFRSASEPSISVSDSVAKGLLRTMVISETAITFSDSTVQTLRRSISISEPTISVSDGVIRVFWAYRTVQETSISAMDAVSAEKYVPTPERNVSEPSISVSDSSSYVMIRGRVITEPGIPFKLELVMGNVAIDLKTGKVGFVVS